MAELWPNPCVPANACPPLCACCPLLALLQELQQQNARLLVVNRQLSQEAEATQAEAEAALRAEYEAGLEAVGKQLDDLRASRISTEKMLQQVGQGSRQHLRRSRWMLHPVAWLPPSRVQA